MSSEVVGKDVDGEVARLQLMSSDNTVFELTRPQAMMSGLLSSCMEDDNEGMIPLERVDAETMRTIVEYLALCEAAGAEPTIRAPLPVTTETLSTVVSTPFAALLEPRPREEVTKLIVAADYMQLNGLVSLCAARLALYIKHMSPEETVKYFVRGEPEK